MENEELQQPLDNEVEEAETPRVVQPDYPRWIQFAVHQSEPR